MAEEEKAKSVSLEQLSKIGSVSAATIAVLVVLFEIIGFVHEWGYRAPYGASPYATGIEPVYWLIEGGALTFYGAVMLFKNLSEYLWYLLLILLYLLGLYSVGVFLRVRYERAKLSLNNTEESKQSSLRSLAINGLKRLFYQSVLFGLFISVPTLLALAVFQHGLDTAKAEISNFQSCEIKSEKCLYVYSRDGKTEIVKGFPVAVNKDMVVLYDGHQSIIYRLTDEQVRRPVVAPSP